MNFGTKQKQFTVLFLCSVLTVCTAQVEVLAQKYSVLRVAEAPIIDGHQDDVWSAAQAVNISADISTGKHKISTPKTLLKLLWDSERLYLFAQIFDSDIWAERNKRDGTLFQENAFEIFIDPEGDGCNYFEIQLNANAAITDLQLTKPYKLGGKADVDFRLQSARYAVQVQGTLNEPAQKDTSWTIEMAIPFSDLQCSEPKTGQQWRVNFARVHWQLISEGGKYKKTKQAAQYFLWQTHGARNMHLPGRFGRLEFLNRTTE